MNRKMLILVLLSLPVLAAAQSRQYSHAGQRDQRFCLAISDSTAFVVAKTRAGATDAEIQAQMIQSGMLPLSDSTRRVAEQNAAYVEPNDVLHASYVDCMRLLGRNP